MQDVRARECDRGRIPRRRHHHRVPGSPYHHRDRRRADDVQGTSAAMAFPARRGAVSRRKGSRRRRHGVRGGQRRGHRVGSKNLPRARYVHAHREANQRRFPRRAAVRGRGDDIIRHCALQKSQRPDASSRVAADTRRFHRASHAIESRGAANRADVCVPHAIRVPRRPRPCEGRRERHAGELLRRRVREVGPSRKS